jgi:hypothetical protein
MIDLPYWSAEHASGPSLILGVVAFSSVQRCFRCAADCGAARHAVVLISSRSEVLSWLVSYLPLSDSCYWKVPFKLPMAASWQPAVQ